MKVIFAFILGVLMVPTSAICFLGFHDARYVPLIAIVSALAAFPRRK